MSGVFIWLSSVENHHTLLPTFPISRVKKSLYVLCVWSRSNTQCHFREIHQSKFSGHWCGDGPRSVSFYTHPIELSIRPLHRRNVGWVCLMCLIEDQNVYVQLFDWYNEYVFHSKLIGILFVSIVVTNVVFSKLVSYFHSSLVMALLVLACASLLPILNINIVSSEIAYFTFPHTCKVKYCILVEKKIL